MANKVQECYRTPNTHDWKRISPWCIIVKTPETKFKKNGIKSYIEKDQVTYKGKPFRITPDCLIKALRSDENQKMYSNSRSISLWV